jgi:GrpB-like predicted nucleotidyltransferase (UPF0157 family)
VTYFTVKPADSEYNQEIGMLRNRIVSLNPMIGPYHIHPPEYRDPDPGAVEVARLVAHRILAQLPMVAVEHVGSTAVPECAGKGIVDLVVIYPAGRLDLVKTILEHLGFQPQCCGHLFPETRPMRVGAVAHRGQTYRLHVHVIAESSPEIRAMCAFRDRLRTDTVLRSAYAGRKRAIIDAGVSDPAAYTQRKSRFIRRALGSLQEEQDADAAPGAEPARQDRD